MVLSSTTYKDFSSLSSFPSRNCDVAGLRDVPRDPVTCRSNGQMASNKAVDRKTVTKVNINNPPQALKKMNAQEIVQQVWILMQYIVGVMAMNRITSNLYVQYIREILHPSRHHDPGTWSNWFSNTFLHQEGEMSASVDTPPPRMTSDEASDVNKHPRDTTIKTHSTQVQQNTPSTKDSKDRDASHIQQKTAKSAVAKRVVAMTEDHKGDEGRKDKHIHQR